MIWNTLEYPRDTRTFVSTRLDLYRHLIVDRYG